MTKRLRRYNAPGTRPAFVPTMDPDTDPKVLMCEPTRHCVTEAIDLVFEFPRRAPPELSSRRRILLGQLDPVLRRVCGHSSFTYDWETFDETALRDLSA